MHAFETDNLLLFYKL